MSRRIIIDEVEFEVPYGKLAAKTWHEETDDCKRILALHGWMDNSGSFDNMMPCLKYQHGFYIVALDLPGHGRSSQLPPGSSYSDLNIVMEIRRCMTELGWIQPKEESNGGNHIYKSGSSSSLKNESINSSSQNEDHKDNDGNINSHKKFSIIGHSLGAGLGLYYASLFPDDVEEVILLDFMKSRTTTSEDLISNTAETIDKFIKTVPSQSPFSSPIVSKSTYSSANNLQRTADKGQVIVSQETAIIATVEAHKSMGELTRDGASCLLKRSTVAVSTPPNSVIYSRDLRLQTLLNLREHIELNKIMFSRIKCHILFVLAKRGLYAKDPLFINDLGTMEQYYRERAKSCHIQWVDTDHYLQMNKPKEVAEIITKFLESPPDYKVTTF